MCSTLNDLPDGDENRASTSGRRDDILESLRAADRFLVHTVDSQEAARCFARFENGAGSRLGPRRCRLEVDA